MEIAPSAHLCYVIRHPPRGDGRRGVFRLGGGGMFDPFERTVRRALRQLAKQRVRVVLQPGNFWVIDNAGAQHEDTHAALLTCYMRGWIEPLEHAVPRARLSPDGSLPANPQFGEAETQYRLTSAGWSAIYRSNMIAIVALLISVLSFSVVVMRFALGA
jgi:hypothetical protein